MTGQFAPSKQEKRTPGNCPGQLHGQQRQRYEAPDKGQGLNHASRGEGGGRQHSRQQARGTPRGHGGQGVGVHGEPLRWLGRRPVLVVWIGCIGLIWGGEARRTQQTYVRHRGWTRPHNQEHVPALLGAAPLEPALLRLGSGELGQQEAIRVLGGGGRQHQRQGHALHDDNGGYWRAWCWLG